ncbi:MAG: hypothetical protein R2750_01405 [Bacteroidales bacterium]
MKTKITQFIPIVFILLIFNSFSYSQIIITSGPEVTTEEVIEFFVGPGIVFDDITYHGTIIARGIFTNGNSSNIGMDEGIFITSDTHTIYPALII